jgi:hypothetical protein
MPAVETALSASIDVGGMEFEFYKIILLFTAEFNTTNSAHGCPGPSSLVQCHVQGEASGKMFGL